jgi:hypothetical protein
MYYAFFTAPETPAFRGKIELRGLAPGQVRLRDHENGKKLEMFDSRNPWMETDFSGHLMFELEPAKPGK